MVLQSESPPCEGGWRGVSLVGRVFRRLLLSACGGVLNPSVCCADSSPRRGAKLPATSPYRIHDRAEKIESSDTAPIRAAPACLQKSLFRQAVKPSQRLERNFKFHKNRDEPKKRLFRVLSRESLCFLDYGFAVCSVIRLPPGHGR